MANSSYHAVAGAARLSAQGATAAWAALVIFTILAWLIARSNSHTLGIAAIVALAGIKIYVLIAVFMGLWHAPKAWHALAIIWIAATCTTVFLFALRSAA